mmetsp:Transcript_731/g.1489  ORF Transcript_731/g.1489 Transcript_731/m.1489 type:complete len:243 (-) Transcript_731:467-1195(-)
MGNGTRCLNKGITELISCSNKVFPHPIQKIMYTCETSSYLYQPVSPGSSSKLLFRILISIILYAAVHSLSSECPSTGRKFFHFGLTRREALLLLSGVASPPATCAAADFKDGGFVRSAAPEPRKIIKLNSGVQFADAYVGRGPFVQDEVVLRVRAMTMNNKVLFDTADSRPIVHTLGSAVDFEDFRTSSSARSIITIGLEDAIVSRGTASWEYGSGKVEPMREGGIRMVVVPSPLAYGKPIR